MERQYWLDYARKEAARQGLPNGVIERLINQESGGNQYDKNGNILTSPAGAMGIMQLMPGTAQGLGVDPRDPMQNIKGGVTYLATQFKKFKSIPLALAAYNAGPGAVQKYGGVPPYKETQNYVKKIMGNSDYSQSSPEPKQPAINPNLISQLQQETVRETMPISPEYKQQGGPLEQVQAERTYNNIVDQNPQAYLPNNIDQHEGYNMRRAMSQPYQNPNPISGDSHFKGNNKSVNNPRYAFELVDHKSPQANSNYNTVEQLLKKGKPEEPPPKKEPPPKEKPKEAEEEPRQDMTGLSLLQGLMKNDPVPQAPNMINAMPQTQFALPEDVALQQILELFKQQNME